MTSGWHRSLPLRVSPGAEVAVILRCKASIWALGLFVQLVSFSALAQRTATESANQEPADVVAPASDVTSAAFEQFAQSAMVDFESGRFDSALALFQRALSFSATREDLATLYFNIGACLMRLERFDEAEQSFVNSSVLDPENAEVARLLAGTSALRAGRVAAAKRYLEGVSTQRPEVAARADELSKAISARESELASEQRSAEYAQLAEEGAAALESQRYRVARRKLEQALSIGVDVQDSAKANLHYGAAVAAYRMKDWGAARQHIAAALRATPNDQELYVLQARVALAQGDAEGAKLAARRAVELGNSAESLDAVEAEIEALSPLPPSGWSGYLTALGGWDTNPLQSGIGVDSGIGSDGSGAGSTTLGALGMLAFTGRTAENTALRLHYSLDWLGLFAEPVQELSLQGHELGTRWYRLLGERFLLRLSGGGVVRLIGLSTPELMSYEGKASVSLTFDPMKSASTQLEIQAATIHGEGDFDYLGGTRIDGQLTQSWIGEPFEWELRGAVRYVGIGGLSFPVNVDEFPVCDALGCVGREYRIPLAYLAPRLGLGGGFDATARWHLGIDLEGEFRQYLSRSMIAGERRSRKVRQDWRWTVGASSEYALDEDHHWSLVLEYGWGGSESNISYDRNDAAHYLDYGDKSFQQHIIEAGLTARL